MFSGYGTRSGILECCVIIFCVWNALCYYGIPCYKFSSMLCSCCMHVVKNKKRRKTKNYVLYSSACQTISDILYFVLYYSLCGTHFGICSIYFPTFLNILCGIILTLLSFKCFFSACLKVSFIYAL